MKFLLFLLFTASYGRLNLINPKSMKKQWDMAGGKDVFNKISVPNEYFNQWWNIINKEMKNEDVSKGLTHKHVEKFLAGMLSSFIENGEELTRELDNLEGFFDGLEKITKTSNDNSTYKKFQFKKLVKKLGLVFGLEHYSKNGVIDKDGDGNCPLDEMQNHADWIMDTTFGFTRIAKNLGYRDQWKLRRIYKAIASSTEYAWSSEISPEDYKLCKNKAVSMANIVIKVIPVYYDYMHGNPVDYCYACP